MAKQMMSEYSERTDKWFKTVLKEPEWMKSVKLDSDNVRLLNIPSLRAWHSFMHDAGKGRKDSSVRDTWSGTATWEDYIELLDKGDERVMNQIKLETKNAIHNLESRYEKVISGYKYDVAGEFFDIGLVLSGVPETWLEPDYIENDKPQIVIRINMSFNAGTNSDNVIANGARLLGMAKVLEDMGVEVGVELFAFTGCNWWRGRKECLVYQFPVKDFNEPINYHKLSSLLTTAHLRRGGFRLKEVVSNNEVDGGYGRPLAPEGFTKISDAGAVDRLEREIFKGFENGKVN